MSALLALLGGLAVLGHAAPARADNVEPAYVFLIDNSGSMHINVKGGPGSDPDRLAVFAARAIIKLLDDKDAATVVPLWVEPNQPEKQLEVLQLSAQHREELLRRVTDKPSGTCGGGSPRDWSKCALADYPGRDTPCNAGFDRVIAVVDQYAKRIKQANPAATGDINIFFLTDGECTNDQGTEVFDAKGKAARLRDAAKGLNVQVNMLTFKDHLFSTEFATMTQSFGGSRVEVNGEDPGGVLAPFAKAIARARGLPEPPTISRDGELQSHRGADRVYLVGVALADKDERLEIEVSDGGRGKVSLTEIATDLFKHSSDTHKYRLYVGYYDPALVRKPLIKVTGVHNWTVLQLPDYRFRVEAVAHKGDCAKRGEKSDHFELNDPVCRVVRLIKRNGSVVEEDFEAVQTGLCDTPQDAALYKDVQQWSKAVCPSALSSKRDQGDVNEYSTTLNCNGIVTMVPWAYVKVGAESRGIFRIGGSETYSCADTSIKVLPSELTLEPKAAPGQSASATFKLDGLFSDRKLVANAVWEKGKHPGRGLKVRINNQPEGTLLDVGPNQDVTVEVVPPNWAGIGDKLDKPMEFRLELKQLDKSGKPAGWSGSAKVKGQWRNSTTLNYDDHKPFQPALKANGPEVSDELKLVEGIPPGDIEWIVRFSADPRDKVPDDLAVEVWDSGKNAWAELTGDQTTREATLHKAATGGKALPLQMRARGGKCCAIGHYRGNLMLAAKGDADHAEKVPIEFKVTEAAWLACNLWWILTLLAVLLVALIIWFLLRIRDGIRPLTADGLARALKLIQYTDSQGMLQNAPEKPHWRKAKALGQGSVGYLLSHVAVAWRLGTGASAIWKIVPFEFRTTDSPELKLRDALWVETARLPEFPVQSFKYSHLLCVVPTAAQAARVRVRTDRVGGGTINSGDFKYVYEANGVVSGPIEFVPTSASAQATVRSWLVKV